jgi:outer membrane immunogenic protein
MAFVQPFYQNHMKKLLIATAIAAASVTPQAFAQAKNFEGFSLSAGVMSLTSSYTGTSGALVSTGGATDTNLALQGQYSWALGDSFVLAAGVQAGVGDFKADSASGKIKNVVSAYIAPGIAVSNNVLVYGKLASVNYDFSNVNGGYSNSGAGYGLGVQVLFGKNAFFQAEYLSVKPADTTFNGWAVSAGNTGVTTLAVGYKF